MTFNDHPLSLPITWLDRSYVTSDHITEQLVCLHWLRVPEPV